MAHDTVSRSKMLFLLSGEGNGTPLQYSCLENPMDGGAWWAAVHGVMKSKTQLTSLLLFTSMHWRKKWQPTPVFLPGNPRDRGAWWAAVYVVAQSQTRLKRLSSSSMHPLVKVKVKLLSRVRLFATPRTVAYQAPPPMGFSRQKYWSGLPYPSPEDLPDSGIEPRFPAL